MEDFIVSARKYRPQTFDSVVGQENITNTLLKSIEQNHLAQAFLFCGPRGVGKTTCARILAKTVNAKAGGETAPDTDYSFNIFELDAASNNSVDDIRNLIDQVRIPPQTGKYKVYIIDEVHMLSTNAFNAFLKTLEEPPAYAIFILATTEKHKVLPTILSRCQIFDFNRIQVPETVAHLQSIAAKEGIEVESDALHIIAEKADGALRDALSIFDRMVSSSGKKVTYDDVISNLNVLDYDYYFSLTDAFLQGDRTLALLTLNKIINKGFDPHNFVNGLADHFRSLLFCVDAQTAAILEAGENVKERYLQQSQRCDIRFLLNALNILSEADTQYKASRNQRLLVELALLKLCKIGGGTEAEKKNDERREVTQGSATAPTPSPEKTAEKPAAAAPPEAASKTESPKNDSPPAPETQPEDTRAPEQPEEAEPKEKPEATRSSAPEQTAPEPTAPAPAPEPPVQETAKADLSSQEKNHSGKDATRADEQPPNVAEEPAHEEELEPQPPAQNSPPPAPASPPPAGGGFSSKLANRRGKGVPSINPAIPNGGNGKSGKAAGSDDSSDAVSPLTGERPATPFNLAQLWEVWDEYAEEIREQDRQSYYATLTKRKPVMREADKIELVIDNHVQLADLESDKVSLLTRLREKLNNWHIQLEGIIEEEESGDDVHLYTPEERFKAMLETNPAIGDLKQRFDLDIEHD